MKRFFTRFYVNSLLLGVVFLMPSLVLGQTRTTIVAWSGSNTNSTATSGTAANTTKTIAATSGVTVTYNTGTCTNSMSATGWDNGNGSKNWSIGIDANGFTSLQVSFTQRSSNTGPRDFKLQYNTGSGWTDATGTGSTQTLTTSCVAVSNFALPTACDNQSNLQLRWIMTSNTSANNGTVASTGTSQITAITVNGLPSTPTTSSISPLSATAGGAGFTLTVNGTNFINGLSTITWNGANRTTTFVSSTQLTASISASDIASQGTATVGVTTTNAASTSNTQTFNINAPAAPTKLVVSSISPTSPTAGSAFSLTVQSQDNSNALQNVSANTSFSLSTNGNAGTIGGTITGTITAGSNSVTVTGITLSNAGTGATITATQTSGDALSAGTSASFNVLAAASQLAFGTSPPSSGSVGVNLASFTVEARRPDNSLDDTYTGNITITKASGSGSLSGTTTVAAVAGIATFSSLQLSTADTYTLTASASGLTNVTSGNITIILSNATTILWSSTNSPWLTASNWTGGAVPTSVQVAQFATNPTATSNSIGINMNGATNNGSNNQIVGAIEVTSARTTALQIGNSSGTVAGTLTLAGVVVNSTLNVIIRNNSSGLLTLQATQGSSMEVALSNTTENVVAIDGSGGVTISSIISGTSKKLTKVGSGSGVLLLTGANTYTGLTTVSAGTLQLNRTGGTTLPITNDVTVTGGTLRVSTNQTLNNLTVNGGNVTVDDGVTLTINGTLALTSGKITLGTGSLVISSSGSISGGSATSYVATTGTGTLTRNGVGTPSVSFPIGTATEYLPITAFANTGTPDNFSAKVSTSAAPSCAVAASALTATWDIAEAIIGGSNVSMTLQYNGSTSKGASFSNATAKLFHCNGSFADVVGTAGASGSDPYTISASNFTSFSPFGVSSDVVLSAELVNLTAKVHTGRNLLTWQTASEQNTSHFDIQRTNHPQGQWQTIGTVKAAGNSSTLKDYQFVDDAPLSISYYRLRSVDLDGKESFSNIVSVQSDKSGKLEVYPSPAKDKLFIRSENTEGVGFEIFNLLGRSVINGQLFGQKELSIAELASGTYILKVGSQVVKFVKE